MISRDLSSSGIVNNESVSLENNPMTKIYEDQSKSHEEHGQEENMATLSTTLIPSDDNIHDEDVMIEENITPFYMTSGRFNVVPNNPMQSSLSLLTLV